MGSSVGGSETGQQHLRALEQANRVRLARAQLKRKVANQEVRVEDVVLHCPWEAKSMSITELLMSQRRWGRTRCRRLLTSLSIPENKRLGTLTPRQRQAVAAMVLRPSSQGRQELPVRPLPAAPQEAPVRPPAGRLEKALNPV